MTEIAAIDTAKSPDRSLSTHKNRYAVLDSWRGICAILVALYHFPNGSFLRQNAFIDGAYLFVDFFFVLSGFVIMTNYAKRLSTSHELVQFVLTRFGRVYPLHLFMLGAFISIEILRLVVPQLGAGNNAPFSGPNSVHGIFTNLLLLQGIGYENQMTWNTPSWSISAEFAVYLLFGMILLAASGRAWMWLSGIAIATPLILLAYSTKHMDVSYDLGLVRCLYGFAIGALLAQLLGSPFAYSRQTAAGSRTWLSWTLIELAITGLIVLFVCLAHDSDLGIAAPIVFALSLYVFTHERGLVSTLLRTRAMLFLGALSYSIYMVHYFIQARMFNVARVLERLIGQELVGTISTPYGQLEVFGPQSQAIALAAMVVMVCLVILTSWFTWRYIEMPALAWFRRKAKHI